MGSKKKSHQSRRGGAGGIESPEERKKWLLDNGRIHAKGLAKTLPRTAEALRNNSFSSEEFIFELRALQPNDFVRNPKIFFLAVQLSLVAVTDQCLVVPFVEDILWQVDQRVAKNDALEQCMGPDDDNKVFPAHVMQEIFDEVCDRWKSRLEVLNGEQLKESCGVYRVSLEEFTKIYNVFVLRYMAKDNSSIDRNSVAQYFNSGGGPRSPTSVAVTAFGSDDDEDDHDEEKKVDSKEKLKQTEIELDKETTNKIIDDRTEFEYIQRMYIDRRRLVAENAIKGVISGDDLLKTTCWKCDAVGEDIQKCGACSIARYCSQKCQVKDWKCSHKEVCNKLKWTYEQTLIHFETVDEMVENESFSNRPVIKGLQPNHLFDYKFARVASITSRKFPYFRPSMDTFYKNLENIFCGGTHWVFKDEPNQSSNSPDNNGNKKKKGKQRQPKQQQTVTKLLPQKPIQDWEAGYILDGMVPLALVTDLSYMSQADQNNIKGQLIQNYGLPKMTARRFLYIYLTRYETPYPNKIKTFRIEAFNSCLRDMRMKF